MFAPVQILRGTLLCHAHRCAVKSSSKTGLQITLSRDQLYRLQHFFWQKLFFLCFKSVITSSRIWTLLFYQVDYDVTCLYFALFCDVTSDSSRFYLVLFQIASSHFPFTLLSFVTHVMTSHPVVAAASCNTVQPQSSCRQWSVTPLILFLVILFASSVKR